MLSQKIRKILMARVPKWVGILAYSLLAITFIILILTLFSPAFQEFLASILNR